MISKSRASFVESPKSGHFGAVHAPGDGYGQRYGKGGGNFLPVGGICLPLFHHTIELSRFLRPAKIAAAAITAEIAYRWPAFFAVLPRRKEVDANRTGKMLENHLVIRRKATGMIFAMIEGS